MANVTITNLTTSPLYIGELYVTIPASTAIVVSRSTADLAAMAGLQAAIVAGNASASIALTSDETASGLAVTSGTIEAIDTAPVAATDAIGTEFEIRKLFTAGGAAGTADDVTIFAAGALPYKMRILDAYALVSTLSAGASKLLQVRDQAAGAGTLCAEISSATPTGRKGQTTTVTATQVITPGALVGLFINRQDRDAAGEVVITARRES